MKRIFKIGELFSGPGGLGFAAKQAEVGNYKCKHVWAMDSDFDSCETYRANICKKNKTSVINKSVVRFKFKKLKKIDALLFGFPCNDFSLVGEKKGLSGKYGGLYTAGIKCLKIFQPDWFLAENVSGISNKKDDFTFRYILQQLQKCGYKLTVHKYKFEQYGVPQKRHRYIIVGFREDLKLNFLPPFPTITDPKKYKSVKDALVKIPKNAENNELTMHSTAVIRRLKHTKPGENAWSPNLPKKFQLTGVKGAKLSQIYRKLKPNEPSYTVTGSGGGGTHVYHWSENRALTNRERATLQTFPTDYVFMGNKESVRKQIGMAVPVKAGIIIIKAILKTIAKKPYKSIIKTNYSID